MSDSPAGLAVRQDVEDGVVLMFIATDCEWRIGRLKFDLKFVDGNLTLEKTT